MIIPVNNLNNKYLAYKNINKNNNSTIKAPLIENKNNQALSDVFQISNNGNITRISFKGRLKDPQVPAIQFKVRGVSNHQQDGTFCRDRNVEDLANSNWKDGKRLSYKIVEGKDNSIISLIDNDYGEIGRVPDEIASSILKILQKHGDDFAFRLSNVIAGTSKSAPTIGIRVNLMYMGKNEAVKQKAFRLFDYLLNSEDPGIKDNILQYQPRTSPREVLERIFDIETLRGGEKNAAEIREAINTISDEINNPENKNILLLGHCLPDGDTIGCVLGMHAAIKSAYPSKNVQCSIDDKIPGLYRDKLPGIENIKRPYSIETINQLEENIKVLKEKEQTPEIKSQIGIYQKELEILRRNETYFDPEVKNGEKPLDYDLIILMDIPTPSRFSSAYKHYIENAKKVIYIDHHPYHYQDWNSAKTQTGIDMEKVREDKLSLVVSSVPAATELVTVIADNAGILKKTMKDPVASKQYTAGIVSGTSSDTGCFARSANWTPDDVKKPVNQRPNYLPEGLSKWLIHKLGSSVDKKWLRENIVYDLSDKAENALALSPRQKMTRYALDSQKIYADNGVGFVNISYDQMYDVWESSIAFDPKITLVDVQNSFKYSEAMGALREAPDKGVKNRAIQPYQSPYQDDKIAVLLIQDRKKDRIDENSKLADKNGIRMSFRSKEGTIYAEFLASLFGGGGHGAAAGGRIDLDGIELNSRIVFNLDGQKEYDIKKIYEALKENYIVKNDPDLNEKEKMELMHSFVPVLDDYGKTIQNIINSVVFCIRKDSNE